MQDILSIVHNYADTRTCISIRLLNKKLSKLEPITKMLEYEDRREYRVGKSLHRKDGPAYIKNNGNVSWWLRGKLHRVDGPAIINTIYQAWYIHGVLHRNLSPARIWAIGIKEWYNNGRRHREDGNPAFISTDTRKWYVRGSLEKYCGPSVVHDYKTEWYRKDRPHKLDANFWFTDPPRYYTCTLRGACHNIFVADTVRDYFNMKWYCNGVCIRDEYKFEYHS